MKSGMLLGVVAAFGLLIQILLGFVLARSSIPFPPALIVVHIGIGITGVALVAFLLGRAYYSSRNGIRMLYILTFVLVLAQVALGFRILVVADEQLLMGHEGLAFGILVLLALAEMLGARQRRKMETGVPAQVVAK
jgi:heme A synthase